MVDAVGATNSTASSALQAQRTSLSNNFDMFLTLLTEQMKNQDPLNPQDSNEFVNQLVQFSNVEQQIQQNEHLESLLLLQSAAAQASAVSYIGRTGLATTPDTTLSAGEAKWAYTLPEDSTGTTLIVRDSEDREVFRATGESSTGTYDFIWDGRDAAGAEMPDGVYSLEVLAVDSDGNSVNPEILATSRVTGVDLSGAEVVVEMGDVRVPLSSVLAVQENQTNT